MEKSPPSIFHHLIAHILCSVAIGACLFGSAHAKNNCEVHAATVNPAIVAQMDSGIGGTGIAPGSGIGGTGLYEGGIGGTGNLAGGIGGTGHVASDGGIGGTGVIGIITGFASICVNGIEIHYDRNTPVQVDGRPGTMRDLAAGQLIVARAAGAGQELAAQHIAIIHAAAGPIGSMDRETGEMRVLGQTVHIARPEDRGNLSALKTGEWVQVSGHRLADGTIVASRIEAITPMEARLNGHITRIDSQGFEVNGTRVHYDAQSLAAGIAEGMEISVAGHWDGARLQAQQVMLEPSRQSMGNVQHIVIEGYIHAIGSREINLGNRIVTLDTNSQSTNLSGNELRLDQRIQITGQTGPDQRITTERIDIKQALPLHIEQSIERDVTGDAHKDYKKSAQDESDGGDKDQAGKDRRGKEDEPGNSGKEELKKGSGDSPEKKHESENQSRLDNRGKPFHDEKNGQTESPDRGKLSDNEHRDPGSAGEGTNSGQSERTGDFHSHEPLNDSREGAHHSDIAGGIDRNERDHGGYPDRDSGHRDIDISDNVRDHSGHQDRDFIIRDRDFDR